jgi:hypothetical protein
MKLYYKIMVSSIYTSQHNGPISDIWKFASSFYFAVATSMYVMLFFLILNNFIVYKKLSFLILNISHYESYNFIFNLAIYVVLPLMLINYYIFLKDNNYKDLVKLYKKHYSKRAFAIYFGLALLAMFFCLFLKR